MNSAAIGCACLLCGASVVGDAVRANAPDPVSVIAIPPAPATENQYIGFELRAPWMDGYVRVRFPENINSKLGMHFLDNLSPEMKRVSDVKVPEWTRDERTDAISYEVHTREGIHFAGRVRPDGDAVDLEFRVRNETGTNQNLNSQVCVDLSPSADFNEWDDLKRTYAWFEGEYRSLADATSQTNKRNKTGFDWLLMLPKRDPEVSLRTIEPEMPWWISDQQADYEIVARVSRDGKHLIAVTWDDTVRRLMTNTSIPCLHADPLHCENLAPGAEFSWHGRIYLTVNDPQRLLARYREDAERR